MIILTFILAGFGIGMQPFGTDCILHAGLATGLIKIDGVLDEEDWQNAIPVNQFRQVIPDEGQRAVYESKVRIIYDQNTVYIGAVLHDSDPRRIRKTIGVHDQFNDADWFSVGLDSNDDDQTAFYFAVNAAGVMVDGFQSDGEAPSAWMTTDLFDERLFQFEPDWDAEWISQVRISNEGWTIEIALPMSVLGIQLHQQNWGVNFSRWIPHLAEFSEWALVPLDERNGGTISHFGQLHLTTKIRPPIYRHGMLKAFAPAFKSTSDEKTMIVPIPNAQGGISFGGHAHVQITAVPDVSPETVLEAVNDFNIEESNSINYNRLYPSIRQSISTASSGSSLLFDRITSTECAELLIGGTSLSGRLPGRISIDGIGGVYLPTTNNEQVPIGFAGRIQKQIRNQSRIGVSATSMPFNQDSALRINAYDGILSGATMDWEFRHPSESSRWVGQMGVSRFSRKNYCGDQIQNHDFIHAYPESQDGFIAQTEYGQLGKKHNWFARVSITDQGFLTPSLQSRFHSARVEVTTGFRQTRSTESRFFRKSHFNVAVSQWNDISDLAPKETILSGEVAALTHTYNVVSIATHAGILSSGHARLGVNLSISSDIRRRWKVIPYIGIDWSQRGIRHHHASLKLTATAGSRIALNTQIMASHTTGDMKSPQWFREFLVSNPSFSAKSYDRHPFVQCQSGVRIKPSIDKSSRCLRAYAVVVAGLFRSMSIEMGIHAQGIGRTTPTGQSVLSDGRAELLGIFRWKIKRRVVLMLGANIGRAMSTYSGARYRGQLFELITAPLEGENFHVFSFSIARKWQR
ncbi:MAG: carbohydrate binding family 9 domain-containing protein [Bacteroidetes bacterium]|nr:carbohydrate binding family 9 domain-containing protein [Bacteroidota bacterium]